MSARYYDEYDPDNPRQGAFSIAALIRTGGRTTDDAYIPDDEDDDGGDFSREDEDWWEDA